MRAILSIGSCAAILLAACGGGGASPTPIADAGAAVSQAANATAALDSYHLEIIYSPIGAPIVYPIDYEGGNWAEHIPEPETGGSSDYVYHGETTYRRDCTPQGTCGNWRSEPGILTIPSLAGKVNSIPETLSLYLARMAKGLTLADAATMKYSGTVDLTAASQENQFQAFLANGSTPQEAAGFVQQLWAGQPSTQGDSAIDIWLTPDARYLSAVTVYVPSQPTDPYFEAKYSSQNAITVQPPAGFP